MGGPVERCAVLLQTRVCVIEHVGGGSGGVALSFKLFPRSDLVFVEMLVSFLPGAG